MVIGDSTRDERVTCQTLACPVSCHIFSLIPTLGEKNKVPSADCPDGPDADLEIYPYEVGVRIPIYIDEKLP